MGLAETMLLFQMPTIYRKLAVIMETWNIKWELLM